MRCPPVNKQTSTFMATALLSLGNNALCGFCISAGTRRLLSDHPAMPALPTRNGPHGGCKLVRDVLHRRIARAILLQSFLSNGEDWDWLEVVGAYQNEPASTHGNEHDTP